MSQINNSIIQNFVDITGLNFEEAEKFMKESNFDVNTALNKFYDIQPNTLKRTLSVTTISSDSDDEPKASTSKAVPRKKRKQPEQAIVEDEVIFVSEEKGHPPAVDQEDLRQSVLSILKDYYPSLQANKNPADGQSLAQITLPFESLTELLNSHPDKAALRQICIEVGSIDLIFSRLKTITEIGAVEVKEVKEPEKKPVPVGKKHLYSLSYLHAGLGMITSKVTSAREEKQKSEEEQISVLLNVLSSFINPGDGIPNADELDSLTEDFLVLLTQSCLVSVLRSYLRNDSVLDIMRHIPLYQAILKLIRAFSTSAHLVNLMTTKPDESSPSIADLLESIKSSVDTYASRLQVSSGSQDATNLAEMMKVWNIDGFVQEIQETAVLVQSASGSDTQKNNEDRSNVDTTIKSIEQKYLEDMKKLQYDSYDIIVQSGRGIKFTVAYNYEAHVRKAGSDRGLPARVKRLAQEAATLSTSLPLSLSSSVFVRGDSDRLDVMKVLITGPADTPYANGCFEFDVYFPPEYPNTPMLMNLTTTGRKSVRFNPNLYNCGKICLSILNTWSGTPEEQWNPKTSSLQQVVVSIQSLIMVPDPYFNEPGWAPSRGTPNGKHASLQYNHNLYPACVQWAMVDQIRNSSPCFKEVIHKHFWFKRNEICQQIEKWLKETKQNGSLRQHYLQLREEFAKLPTPEGLENFDNPFDATPPSFLNSIANMLPSPSALIPQLPFPSLLTTTIPKKKVTPKAAPKKKK